MLHLPPLLPAPAPARTDLEAPHTPRSVARGIRALRRLGPIATLTVEPPAAAPPAADDMLERLQSLTKQELYRRARELDLPGRSAMNKTQLVMALVAHARKRQLSRAARFEEAPSSSTTSRPSWIGSPLAATPRH